MLLLLKGALIRAKIVKQSLMLVGVTVGGAYTATPKSLADSRKGVIDTVVTKVTAGQS